MIWFMTSKGMLRLGLPMIHHRENPYLSKTQCGRILCSHPAGTLSVLLCILVRKPGLKWMRSLLKPRLVSSTSKWTDYPSSFSCSWLWWPSQSLHWTSSVAIGLFHFSDLFCCYLQSYLFLSELTSTWPKYSTATVSTKIKRFQVQSLEILPFLRNWDVFSICLLIKQAHLLRMIWFLKS